jgi:hypothetical protein
MSDTNETNETNETTMTDEEQVEYYRERLRAIGFISAAALTEPDEEVSQHLAGMAERMLDIFLRAVPDEKARELVEQKIEDFAVEAYKEFEL